jgi:hypothetical protein
LLAVLGQWTQHVTTTSRDDLGRWVLATLAGSDSTQTTIYSCYNVVDTNIANVGPSTVFAQQYQLLRLAGNPQPNPRRQFVEDLKKEVAVHRRNHEELIICDDFNERLGNDPNLMSTVCATHDLFDVHGGRLGDTAQVPTYIRGSKKLDYVFASLGLDRHVTSCDLNLFNEHFTSDHRALFADFSLTAFLGTTIPVIVRSNLRFMSSDSADVAKFIGTTYPPPDENKVFHLYQDFLLDADLSATPWELANKIDTLMGQAFQCAEKTCVKPKRLPWSLKLHKSSRKVRFWKTALKQQRTGVSQSAVLVDIGKIVWGTAIPPVPSNERSLISVGCAVEKALKRIRKNAKNERTEFLRAHRERLALRVTPKDTEVADAIQMIDRQLANTCMFGRIKSAVKPLSSTLGCRGTPFGHLPGVLFSIFSILRWFHTPEASGVVHICMYVFINGALDIT